jgi:hypothetical protein
LICREAVKAPTNHGSTVPNPDIAKKTTSAKTQADRRRQALVMVKQYVYIWADGIHVNVRLEDTENKRQCLLVVMGAMADGYTSHVYWVRKCRWTVALLGEFIDRLRRIVHL